MPKSKTRGTCCNDFSESKGMHNAYRTRNAYCFFRRLQDIIFSLIAIITLLPIMIFTSMISHSEFSNRAYWRLLAIVIIVSYLIE